MSNEKTLHFETIELEELGMYCLAELGIELTGGQAQQIFEITRRQLQKL